MYETVCIRHSHGWFLKLQWCILVELAVLPNVGLLITLSFDTFPHSFVKFCENYEKLKKMNVLFYSFVRFCEIKNQRKFLQLHVFIYWGTANCRNNNNNNNKQSIIHTCCATLWLQRPTVKNQNFEGKMVRSQYANENKWRSRIELSLLSLAHVMNSKYK
jgi:hypothetical protein